MPRLGQHFLKDEWVLESIVRALAIKSDGVVVEIGPGHGELTDLLVKVKKIKILAIEKDSELASSLKNRYEKRKNIKIVTGDALKELPLIIKNLPKYKLVGNIPYYITGFLLRTIGGLHNKPELIVFTIQKEVAERISAIPPRMNLLAASVGFWGTPGIIQTIKRGSFSPPPKVDSAVLRIITSRKRTTVGESKDYYEFIRTLFKQPRKTVLNNLSDGLKRDKAEVLSVLKKQGVAGNSRPQDLGLEKIGKLSAVFRPHQ